MSCGRPHVLRATVLESDRALCLVPRALPVIAYSQGMGAGLHRPVCSFVRRGEGRVEAGAVGARLELSSRIYVKPPFQRCSIQKTKFRSES
jgi:hypothetical protein